MNLDAIKQSESASFKKRNPHIFGGGPLLDEKHPYGHVNLENAGGEDDEEMEHIAALTAKPKPKKKRIRQSEKPLLNNLEEEYLQVLRLLYNRYGVTIHLQAIRLRLANGLTYTPDFFVLERNTTVRAYEVKGKHAWDDAIVKLKCAAVSFPNINFYLVWKQDGQWQEQHVLP